MVAVTQSSKSIIDKIEWLEQEKPFKRKASENMDITPQEEIPESGNPAPVDNSEEQVDETDMADNIPMADVPESVDNPDREVLLPTAEEGKAADRSDSQEGEETPEPDEENSGAEMLGYVNTGNGYNEDELLPIDETPLKNDSTVILKTQSGDEIVREIVEYKGRGGFALTYKVKEPKVESNFNILKEFCPLGARRHTNGKIIPENNEHYKIGMEKFPKEPGRINDVSLELLKNPQVKDEDEAKKLKNEVKECIALAITSILEDDNGNSYFLQEYAEGENLMEFMKKGNNGKTPMTVSLALDIIEQLAFSVITIHKCNVIHQDISPYNFIFYINAKNEVKLKVIDFGVSTNIKEERDEYSFAQVGTSGFMDQSAKFIPQGEEWMKVDVYSMAAVLNYMLFLEYDSARYDDQIHNNDASLKYLNDNTEYVMKASKSEEEKRTHIIRLIKDCIVPAKRNTDYEQGFRMNAAQFLQRIENIKANLYINNKNLENKNINDNTEKISCNAKENIDYISFTSDVGWLASIEFPSEEGWKKDESEKWLKMESDSSDGGGEFNIKVTVEPNTTGSSRMGRIVITNQILKIYFEYTQEANEHPNHGIPVLQQQQNDNPEPEALAGDMKEQSERQQDAKNAPEHSPEQIRQMEPEPEVEPKAVPLQKAGQDTVPEVDPVGTVGTDETDTKDKNKKQDDEKDKDKEKDKNKDKNKYDYRRILRWALGIVLVLCFGIGGYHYMNTLTVSMSDSDMEQNPNQVAGQTNGQDEQQTAPALPAVTVNQADSLDSVFIGVTEGRIELEQVLERLAMEVQLYERYEDNDVEVGSTLEELLRQENHNIVFGKTHRVIEVYTNEQTGLIYEIIIERK